MMIKWKWHWFKQIFSICISVACLKYKTQHLNTVVLKCASVFPCFSQEKRIYDLKKKNQELEKFKFVLDYKIKELKKQIEPRETDIKNMKEQIQEVTSHNKTILKLSILRVKKSTVGQEMFGERFLLILSELQYCTNNCFSVI